MKYDKNELITLKCLPNVVMMKFVDETSVDRGQFKSVAKYGIIIPAFKSEQKKHRWAEVKALGSEAEADGLKIGDYILVESMMWMEASKVNGERWNKTDTSKILAVTNDRASCELQNEVK